jgi:hypothetical protein
MSATSTKPPKPPPFDFAATRALEAWDQAVAAYRARLAAQLPDFHIRIPSYADAARRATQAESRAINAWRAAAAASGIFPEWPSATFIAAPYQTAYGG